MEQIYKERLLGLADHLETGKLGHEVFDFSCWNRPNLDVLTRILGSDTSPMQEFRDQNTCGYAGCAIGECPIRFPEEWGWLKGAPVLLNMINDNNRSYDSLTKISGEYFFGLESAEFDLLFVPSNRQTTLYGFLRLRSNATKEQVAENIRRFVEYRVGNIEEAEA